MPCLSCDLDGNKMETHGWNWKCLRTHGRAPTPSCVSKYTIKLSKTLRWWLNIMTMFLKGFGVCLVIYSLTSYKCLVGKIKKIRHATAKISHYLYFIISWVKWAPALKPWTPMVLKRPKFTCVSPFHIIRLTVNLSANSLHWLCLKGTISELTVDHTHWSTELQRTRWRITNHNPNA